jgi:hypothetical protein
MYSDTKCFEFIKVLAPNDAYIIAPVDEMYEYKKNVFVANLGHVK